MNDMDFISFPPRPFHCIPRGDVFYISLLPGGIFHCLPRAIIKIFHCSLGRYFIGCLDDILFISLLPRAIFHCCPGQYLKYFIAAWGDIFTALGIISLLSGYISFVSGHCYRYFIIFLIFLLPCHETKKISSSSRKHTTLDYIYVV